VVQLAASQAPAKPRMEIDGKALAKLHPKAVRSVATTETPTPDIANLEQHTALLNIASSTNGPAKPKLEINPSSAPHVGHQSQPGDVSAAPAPEVPIG